jgi:hypothetical protein
MESKPKLLLVLFALAVSFSFKPSHAQIEFNNIIGNWSFVEMLDTNNKHIDTLWGTAPI